MGNVTLGFPNNTDTSVLSGGSWVSTLPITNMQVRTLGKVARTTDATKASTQFNVVLDKAKRINTLSFVNHNFSLQAKYRIRASNEATMTNLCLYSEQFDNAIWSKTTTTVTANSTVAPDGNTTADSLTATGTNSGVLQSITAANSTYTYSIWVKRLTGSGAISLTIDGSTYTSITPTTAFTRFTLTGSLANPTIGVRIATSGDSIAVWGAQLEASATFTSYYPSVATQGVRAAGYIDTWQSYEYDTGWGLVYPIIYPYAILEWSDDNWWSGRPTLDDITGYTTCLTSLSPEEVFARYWKIEIDDTLNSAGYVQIGRLFIAPTWTPNIGVALGGETIGWETKTESQETISGNEFFQKRTPYRVVNFSLELLTEDEAFSKAFEIMRRAGIDQEVLWVHDPSDTVHSLRRRYLGRLRQLSKIEYPYGGYNKTAWEVKELL